MELWSFKVVNLDACGSLVLSNPVTYAPQTISRSQPQPAFNWLWMHAWFLDYTVWYYCSLVLESLATNYQG